MVMLYRVFLTNERAALAQERKIAKGKELNEFSFRFCLRHET